MSIVFDFLPLAIIILFFAAAFRLNSQTKSMSRSVERRSAKAIRPFLSKTYSDADISDNRATFTHGQVRCALKWRNGNEWRGSQVNPEKTILSFHVPDWMAEALAREKIVFDTDLPHQFYGLLLSIPQEYTDFVEGRMEGRLPSVPFVNAKSRNKALEDVLQHDLELYGILSKMDLDDLEFKPTFKLKGKRFSAETPTLLHSGSTAWNLISMSFAILKRAYLAACQVHGVQPVDRETMDATFGAPEKSKGGPGGSGDAIAGELAEENFADGDGGDETLALGDGDH